MCRCVSDVCAAAAALGDPVLAAEVAPVAATLAGPLRVAIAGRIKAGKSTLVNALLERRVAPTKATECTMFATWYHYGLPERVVVRRRDGTSFDRDLTADGRLPDEVGVASDSVERLDVYLSQSVLRDMTIIDTPGLASLNEANSARTEDLLVRSTQAAERAEAIVFVFTLALKGDERDMLCDFHDTSASVAGHSPVNAIGVLSRVDTLAPPNEDPWPVADERAGFFADRLAHEVATVFPVNGLIAESVGAGAFSESHAATLAQLSELEPRQRRRLLRSVDAFVSDDVGVPVERRRELLLRLDLHGVVVALAEIDAGRRGAVALGASLLHGSRISGIREALLVSFAFRSDAIKASWALGQLDQLADSDRVGSDAREWLSDRLEEIRLTPVMHRIDVIGALNDAVVGAANLPEELVAALTRLADGATPAQRVGLAPRSDPSEVVARARELGSTFSEYAFDAFAAEAHVARIAARACHLVALDAVGSAQDRSGVS